MILYLRLIHRAGVALLAAALLLLNLRFYLPNAADYGPDRIGANVVPQLTFIGAALRDARVSGCSGCFRKVSSSVTRCTGWPGPRWGWDDR